MGSRSCRNRIGWTTPRVKPFSFAAATTRSAPSRFIAIGISTNVCLPCSREASAISAWVSLGPAMITTSTSGSSSASPRLVVHFLYPYFSANVAVVGGLLPTVGVAGDSPAGLAGRPTTVGSCASSTRRSASECQTPIMPWPTMQIFSIGRFLLFVGRPQPRKRPIGTPGTSTCTAKMPPDKGFSASTSGRTPCRSEVT